MKFTRGLFALAILAGVNTALAGSEIEQLQNASRAEFRLLSEDLGAALSYKLLSPFEPLEAVGFDISISLSATELEGDGVPDPPTSSSASSTNLVATLQVVKGLPLGIHIGGSETEYVLNSDGVAMPASAVRGSSKDLSAVIQFGFETKNSDVSASEEFSISTPEFDGTSTLITSTTKDVTLAEEKLRLNEDSGGVNLNFGQLNVVLEADQTGDVISYGATLGLRF